MLLPWVEKELATTERKQIWLGSVVILAQVVQLLGFDDIGVAATLCWYSFPRLGGGPVGREILPSNVAGILLCCRQGTNY